MERIGLCPRIPEEALEVAVAQSFAKKALPRALAASKGSLVQCCRHAVDGTDSVGRGKGRSNAALGRS